MRCQYAASPLTFCRPGYKDRMSSGVMVLRTRDSGRRRLGGSICVSESDERIDSILLR